jgi:photosystem II stability/assembly factor-like uncharacterized protein
MVMTRTTYNCTHFSLPACTNRIIAESTAWSRDEGRWVRIGERMPKSIGDIGFPILLDPRDPERVWVFPMDGTSVWPRTSPGGRPALYRTANGGKTWKRLDKGLPRANAWFTVFRQAMARDDEKRMGIYFGTTAGEVWGSRNEGESWQCLARHLPEIYSVETVGVS